MNLPQPKMFLWDALIELGYKDRINGATEDEILWKNYDPSEEELAAIEAKKNELKTAYDNLAYSRLRKMEYDKLNQYEMMYNDQVNGTTTWQDAIEAIKAKYPKPE